MSPPTTDKSSSSLSQSLSLKSTQSLTSEGSSLGPETRRTEEEEESSLEPESRVDDASPVSNTNYSKVKCQAQNNRTDMALERDLERNLEGVREPSIGLMIFLIEINIIYRNNQIFWGFKYSQKT